MSQKVLSMKNKTLLAFCLKAVMLLVILFGVDRLVGVAFVKMKDVGLVRNQENMWLKTPFTVEKVDADVVVIGSSKASHHYVTPMLEESLGMTAYNCGQDGCFFLYQNCIVNMVLDRYQPKVMIWDIQPGSFTSKGLKEYQNVRYLSPYYVNNEWVKSFVDSESDKMVYRMMSRMFGYNSKLLNYVVPLVTHSSSILKGYIPLPAKGYKYPEKIVGKELADLCINESYLKLLDETLSRCKERGVQLVLCISPEFAEKRAIVAEIESAIGHVVAENGARFVNCSADEFFMQDSTLFKDTSHLNDKGARFYTQLIIKEIKNNG